MGGIRGRRHSRTSYLMTGGTELAHQICMVESRWHPSRGSMAGVTLARCRDMIGRFPRGFLAIVTVGTLACCRGVVRKSRRDPGVLAMAEHAALIGHEMASRFTIGDLSIMTFLTGAGGPFISSSGMALLAVQNPVCPLKLKRGGVMVKVGTRRRLSLGRYWEIKEQYSCCQADPYFGKITSTINL